jgi:hypothetical protein
MARTKQTSRQSQAKALMGGKGKAPTKTKGIAKKPRAPKDPNKPQKPTVMHVVSDAEIPQYTANLTKLWIHLKANPDENMLAAAASAWTDADDEPTHEELLAQIAKVPIGTQCMNMMNEYLVDHMEEVCKVQRGWYGRTCAGKTINVARLYASFPSLYLRAKQRFEAEGNADGVIKKYEASFQN